MSSRLDAGTRSAAVIEIRNTGTESWTPNSNIRVSYHWLTASGELVTRDGERTPLTALVRAGETVRVCATVLVPRDPGEYQLEWDMVREGVAWFSDGDASPHPRLAVIASATDAAGASDQPLAKLLLFFGVTTGHLLLTAFWMGPLYRRPAVTLDEWLFGTALVCIGTFQGLLHAVACSVGLSLTSVTVAVVAWHVFLAAVHRRLPRALAGKRFEAEPLAPFTVSAAPELLFQWTGLIVLTGIVVQWFETATASMAVEGTDAAHYHVPNAVNFALGANPLNFTATPHLYPMGTSVLAAWFILPLRDPLLIDLAMVPLFLLVVSALAWLFRLVTGESGIAWVPWLVLVLFATPLLQVSSLVSADLMYTAAFLALNTQLFKMWRRNTATPLDLMLTASAFGLLLGSKATGAVSATLLVCVYGTVWGLSHLRATARRPTLRLSSMRWVIGGVVLAIAAGGIWELRNWINFGSPLAPSGLTVFGLHIFGGDSIQSGRYYLSVMKDLRDVPNYSFAGRSAHYIRQWLGSWFLPSTLAVFALIIDALYARRGPYASERLWLAVLVMVLMVPHVALLVQAPWSSLEWTRGLALRYVLPFFVLWPFLAFLALFPLSWPWWKRAVPSTLMGGTFVAGAVTAFAKYAHMPALPTLSIATIELTALALGAVLAVIAAGRSGTSAWKARGAAVVLGATLVWTLSSMAAAADVRLRPASDWATNPPAACVAESAATADRFVAAYMKVLDYEQRTGTTCTRRRFFMAGRFDSPMALQPTPYGNLVYDARPRTIVERAMEKDGPGTGQCDYVIASEAELQTDHGTLLISRLRREGGIREVGVSHPYVVFVASRRR